MFILNTHRRKPAEKVEHVLYRFGLKTTIVEMYTVIK